MESANITMLLEQLDDDVDNLEEVIAPILESSVIETSKKLPVLDKAKFHVVITYALESLIFSYLRLHGVKATEHPVFRELKRVKQYFDKIKELETEPEKRTMVLDKQAAGRFIKHGLAGNDKLDLQREEQLAKEKARAQFKASRLAQQASATPEILSKNDSSDSESDADAPQSLDKPVDNSQKSKNSKSKSGTKEGKNKKRRSKEERSERRKERRKKKDATRKARKQT
ncbi:Sas10/Utp3/C1D family protein [Aspergillus undulatus]|uniref:Sas10/Utp3/C1D family protein n=1 Tax=Aspergillus undulatus TaxID=1810928 RepID=UPI003CCD291A